MTSSHPLKHHVSPSGQYLLTVETQATKPGCWNYTVGRVYRRLGTNSPVDPGDGNDFGELIAEVKRNYSSFPFLFIEGHPNGHDYLVCGAHYQGQTVIELDTHRRRDQGRGFCWSEYRFDAASQILIVHGCYWAAPYEFKFFDFSDPMGAPEPANVSHWPELELSGFEDEMGYFCGEEKWPSVGKVLEGTCVVLYQTRSPDNYDDRRRRHDDDDDDDDDDDAVVVTDIAATATFWRQGAKLVLTEGWVSQKEQAYRAAQDEARERYEAKWAAFRATDPLYLGYLEFLKSPVLSPEAYESTGITHEGWAPPNVFSGNELRVCRRIVGGSNGIGKRLTIDLDWGIDKGPVKITVYRDGKHTETRFFEHLVTGMSDAFLYAERLVKELPQ